MMSFCFVMMTSSVPPDSTSCLQWIYFLVERRIYQLPSNLIDNLTLWSVVTSSWLKRSDEQSDKHKLFLICNSCFICITKFSKVNLFWLIFLSIPFSCRNRNNFNWAFAATVLLLVTVKIMSSIVFDAYFWMSTYSVSTLKSCSFCSFLFWQSVFCLVCCSISIIISCVLKFFLQDLLLFWHSIQ